MMIYAVSLIFLAMQSVIVWRVVRNGRRIDEAINLLGEMKMQQEDFDKKVNELNEKVTGLDSKLDSESGEIAGIVAGYKAEIQRLKDSQGDNIDTSRLDELSNSLDAVGTRIGGLVDPLPVEQTPPVITEPAPAPTVDPLEPVKEDAEAETPATSVESETTVTTKTEDAEGNKVEEEATTATDTSTAGTEAESETSEEKDEE